MSRLTSNRALIGYAVGALAFLGGAFFFATHSTPALTTFGGGTMGTTWSLQYWDDIALDPALEIVLAAELARLDKEVFSTYAADSELSRLNRNATPEAVNVSPDLFAALQLARQVYEQSEGAFDPTVGPLVQLWGFGPDAVDEETLPDEAAIAAARSKLGMQSLQLQEETRQVLRERLLELDLSSVAEGFAADMLAALLQVRGIDNYLLEVGREMRIAGNKPDASSWRIAIEKPQNGMPEAFAVLDTQGAALALSSSGDYRNYREIAGKRYSHEIDPRSGWPIAHALTAVTVVADTAALADAWSTALMVLGPQDGLRIADGLGLSAYFILHTDQGLAVQSSQRFKERFSGLDAL